MDTAERIVESAIKEFKATLDDRKLEQFSGTTATHIKKRITGIQAYHEISKSIINFTRLQSFLEAWEQFDNSCRALQVGAPQLSGFIWGPLDWVLRVASEEPKVLDRILQSYLALGQRLAPIAQQGSRLTEQPSLRKCLAWMYNDLLIFHKHILKLFEPRGWRATFEAQWKDYNDESLFKSLLDSFEKNGECINRSIGTQSLQDSQQRLNDHVLRYRRDAEEILRHISEYEEDREKLFAEAEKNETSRKHAQYLEILKWLRSPLESEKRRHEHCQSVRYEYPNTGNWILNEDKIDDWMNLETPPYSMLWLQGVKGAGKTILTSLIIDHLTTTRSDANTSYFYCKSGDEKSGEGFYISILKSLLRQILSHNRDLLAVLFQRRVNGRNGVEILDDEGTAKSLLEMLCDLPVRQFIVIDGLDEMERTERKAVISCLSSIVQKSDGYNPGRIRVLFVSTDLDDLRALTKSVDYLEVYDLVSGNLQSDIELYLEKRSIAMQTKFQLSEREAKRAVGLIAARSHGMFLYAFLVSENLMKQPTAKKFFDELATSRFPEDLEQAYDRIIQRLQSDNASAWEEAKKVFGWLICATRPLKWHELQAALSMRVDEQGSIQYSHTNRLCSDIREVCGSLIRVIGNTIEFIHQTAEIYVIKNESLHRGALESDVTLFCLSYLSHHCFNRDLDQHSMDFYVKDGLYAFQDYAVARWDLHLRSMIGKHADIFKDPLNGDYYERKTRVILHQFYVAYQADLTSQEHDRVSFNTRVLSDCESVKDLLFYNVLVPIWSHMLRHHGQGMQKRYQVNLDTLGKTLEKSRTAIRTWSDNGASVRTVEDYYGNNLYKCSRATCAFFYEGFDTEAALEHHSNRHERPYTCPHEATCSLARFGFATNRDRDRHIRIYHPDQPGEEGSSSQATSIEGTQSPPENGGPKFQCDHCPNKYTRKANLEAHMNSAHLGRRPYECSVCGRPFTRRNDVRRHEKTKHTRR